MIFINKPTCYWLRPTYSVLVGGIQYDNKARLIEAVLARIGRDKPMYSDKYGKVAVRLCNRYSDGLGVQTLMKAMHVTDKGRYTGHGVGRFIFENGCGRFDADKYDMEPEEGADVCIIDDWYKCDGCGKRRDKTKDPAQKEYIIDYAQSRIGGRATAMTCCKKCRAEMRKMTKAFLQIKECKRLLNQLKKEETSCHA